MYNFLIIQFFRVVSKIKIIYYRAYLNYIFSNVNCDLNKIVLGADCKNDFHISSPNNLTIGDGTVLNGYCYINAFGGVKIGIYCHIGKGLTIFSHNHNYNSIKSIPYDDQDIIKPVLIGDFVWIGTNVTINPGINIGEGVVVAAGSVVTSDIPSCAIIGGNPAKIIKYRDVQVFNKLKNERAFF